MFHDGASREHHENPSQSPLFQRGRLLLPLVKGGGEGFKNVIL
jgi:hypothetical protein